MQTREKVKTHKYGGRERTSSMGEFLKSMYLNGRMTGGEVQEGAAAAGNHTDALCKTLAKAGNAGSHRGNCHRDIMTALDQGCDRPPVYETDIWFWDGRTKKRLKKPCHFLLVSETMDHFVGKTNIQDWVGIRDNPHLQSTFETWCNEVGLNPKDTDIVAMGLWGDSAVISVSESLFIVLTNCLSGIHPKRFWLCAFGKKIVCNCGCHGRHTFDSIFKVLQWDFKAFLSGERPRLRDDGVPFSESKRIGDSYRHKAREENKRFAVRGGLIQKRGDWSWLKCALGMIGWEGEKIGETRRCCFKCLANFSNLSFMDFYERALWRQTLLTHEGFLADVQARGCYKSEIFNLPGFTHAMITADLMHCGDLGVLLYLLGIVIWEMAREYGCSFSNGQQQLDHILLMIRMASKALKQKKQPLNHITMSMIRCSAKSSPKLKVKASAARHLLLCLRWVLETFTSLDTPHAQKRFLVVKNFCDMYDSLQNGVGMESMQSATISCRKALILWNELRQEDIDPDNADNWQTRGFFLWKLYPKHHLLQHVLEDQILVSGSPVGHWCYADESEIGAAITVCPTLQYSHLQTSLIKKHRLQNSSTGESSR